MKRGRRRWIFVKELTEDSRKLAFKRPVPGKEFVEHRAQGKNVRTVVDLFSYRLLRRHVCRSANHHAGLRQSRIAEFRNAKIQDLDGALRGQHQVRGLQ